MKPLNLFLILLIIYLALVALAFVGISDAGQVETSIRQDIYGNSSLANGQGISVNQFLKLAFFFYFIIFF